MRLAPFLSALWIAAVLPVAALAQFVPSGDCALVVASRPTLTDAFAYLRETGLDARDIYRTRNGWYAISLGTLRADTAPARLQAMKRSGSIPGDSFCSSGRGFTVLAWSATGPNASAATPRAAATPLPTSPARMDRPFDARPLSLSDKIFLQAALAVTGDYDGLIDGAWGGGSQAAYEAFLARRDWPDSNRSAAGLAILGHADLSDAGWTDFHMPNINASLYYPAGSMTLGSDPRTSTNTIRSQDGRIEVGFLLGDRPETVDYHLVIRGDAGNHGALYSVVTDTQIVTGTRNGGLYVYARSLRDPADGLWSTIVVINDLADRSRRPALMAASFRIGRAVPLRIARGGALDALVEGLAREIDEAEAPPRSVAAAPAPAPTAPATRERFYGNGSGFYVDGNATVMTNAHVVEDCDRLSVGTELFTVLAASETYDLALLAPRLPREEARFLGFATAPARLNSDVTVAGFPLQDVLTGLNITRGSVSAMEGLDELTQMQISAPIQPGNSGGPIVDRFGNVVGIVVSKLNEETIRAQNGISPENINFGVRAGIGRLFAATHGVEVADGALSAEIAPEDLADLLREATVRIDCEGTR